MGWHKCSEGFAQLVETSDGIPLQSPITKSDEFNALLKAGLIVPGLERNIVPCPRCREWHDVMRSEFNAPVVYCVDGAEPVDKAELKRWRCDWSVLGTVIARSLDPSFKPKISAQGIVALVGELSLRNSGIPIWLARGLSSHDRLETTLKALSNSVPRRQGLVISAGRPLHSQLPNGSSSIELAAVFDAADPEAGLDIDAIWRAATAHVEGASSKGRGNPGKPGNPLEQFERRLKAGVVMATLSKEAEAIRNEQIGRLGKDRAHSQSHIENEIRDAYNSKGTR